MINHFLSHCFENAILVQIYLTLKKCELEIAINNETSLFYSFNFLSEYFVIRSNNIQLQEEGFQNFFEFHRTIIRFNLYLILLIT